MLRPGTSLPHPTTVSRDIKAIYEEGSIGVREYFKKRGRNVHLVIDGWTAPLVASYLGICVVWYDGGKIHRAILEFIRLKEKHDGEYLAKCVVECLKRFGLEDLLLSACLDNAGNCDTLVKEAKLLLRYFLGMWWRTCCFPHITNLIAKAFVSFFFKTPKKRKTITVAAGTKRKRGHARSVTTIHVEEEVSVGDPLGLDEDEAEQNEIEETGVLEDETVDDGQVAHDEQVVKTIKGKAIASMALKGITMDSEEERSALQLFPRVAGLAHRVHDSGELKQKFDTLVQADPVLRAEPRTALTRRVPTRWNSDFNCLDAHLYFRPAVEQLTTVSANKLSAYRLTSEQWDLSDDLVDVLAIFDGPTKLFSRADVPLVMDTIPMLEDMETALKKVRAHEPLPNVIRIAAEASLLVIDKYYALNDECEVYRIAIGRFSYLSQNTSTHI